jgi:hypothetical protein
METGAAALLEDSNREFSLTASQTLPSFSTVHLLYSPTDYSQIEEPRSRAARNALTMRVHHLSLSGSVTMPKYMQTIFIAFLILIGSRTTGAGTTADSSAGLHDYFYHPYTFGSQGKYNPGDFFINGGFGVWQFAGTQNVFNLPYGDDFRSTWESITHPIKAIKDFGVENWFFSEICPRSFEMKHGQFIPNYFLHMLGAGMQSRKMEEWYRYHEVPLPRLWSIATMLSEHFFEEMVENGGKRGISEDPVTDYYIFNPAGILLFLNEDICRFFSEKLVLNEWSLQPSINVRTGKLENAGQFYIAKLPLGCTQVWGLAAYFGMQEMFGVTRTFGDDRTISILGGPIVNNLLDANVSQSQKSYTASLRWSAGVFYDVKNSCMVSLSMSGADHNKLRVNCYPGLFRIGPFSPNCYPGLFRIGPFSPGVFVENTGEWVAGVSVRYCPLGISVGNTPK